ncbi:MAG: DUF4230 domain-containing protein [Chloroflexota bacterium]
MENTKGWVLVIGVLAILALLAMGVVWIVQDTVQRTVSPVESMTGNLGTQVAAMLNPTPTILPDPITIIRDVRSLARLETIQYSIEKVITAETGQGLFGSLFGDRLLLVAHGYVIAGIDLAKLSPNDLKVDNGVLYVTLPEPEVFVATLDNDKSYVYDRQTGVLTKGDINLEAEARRVAEEEIEKAAREDGILNLARQNAENYLSSLFVQLGYPEVIFTGATPTP